MQCKRKMMMVYYVLALLWHLHDWYHMMTEKLSNLLRRPCLQAFAFVLDLTHPHCDLRWVELVDLTGLKSVLADVSHADFPYKFIAVARRRRARLAAQTKKFPCVCQRPCSRR